MGCSKVGKWQDKFLTDRVPKTVNAIGLRQISKKASADEVPKIECPENGGMHVCLM